MAQVGEVPRKEKARKLLGDLKDLRVERGVFEEGAEKTFAIGKECEQAGAVLKQETVGNNS